MVDSMHVRAEYRKLQETLTFSESAFKYWPISIRNYALNSWNYNCSKLERGIDSENREI
jgi:hypothetical protein